jgi:uncharacterized protein
MAIEYILFLIGLGSAAYGVMVGAGGGFIFVPALLILMDLPTDVAVGTGLTVVFLNALTGVLGYIRKKRIDYKLGMILATGALPGTFIGFLLARLSSSEFFFLIFAILLIGLGLFLLVKKPPRDSIENEVAASLEDYVQTFSIKMLCMLMIGFMLGIVSSYFGIGGGWLLVPILIYGFHVSPHTAVATSLFSLCLYSSVGVGMQVFYEHISWSTVLWGGLGVISGGQIGVYLSNKVSGKVIVRMLSLLLMAIGIKLVVSY